MPDLPAIAEWATIIGVAIAVIGIPAVAAGILAAIDKTHSRQYYLGAACACLVLAVIATLLLANLGFHLPGSSYAASLRGAANGWTANDFCVDESDGLHIKPLGTQPGLSCLAPFQAVSDADIAVDARQIAGQPGVLFGLIFRYHDTGSTNSYEFVLNGEGGWAFTKIVEGQFLLLQPGETSAAIHQGQGADNRLEVRARGGHFTFSINGTQVGAADDGTLATGVVGVTQSPGCEAVFSNFQITAL